MIHALDKVGTDKDQLAIISKKAAIEGMRIDIINSRFWSVDRRNEPAGNIPPVPISVSFCCYLARGKAAVCKKPTRFERI